MLRLLNRDIILARSELLYAAEFTPELFENDFEVARGDWSVQDGWLTGFMEEDGGGLVYTKRHYFGDILMDFEVRSVEPYRNDLNFTFCAEGWNDEKQNFGLSYIGGLQGWYYGRTGIEKHPDNEVFAVTALHKFEPERTYHIQTGRIGDKLFLFIDGEHIIEVRDPDPITEFGKVGFGVYASKVQFRSLKVYRPLCDEWYTSYVEMRSKK